MVWRNRAHEKPIGLLGKSYLTSCNICEVVIQTEEPVSARESTAMLVKILKSVYAKENLKQVAYNTTHLKSE